MKKHISKICGHKITCGNKEQIKKKVDYHVNNCKIAQDNLSRGGYL